MQSQLKFSRNKERARISILFPDESEQMTVQIDQPYAMGGFRLNLENLGTTPAFKIVAEYNAFACNRIVDRFF